MNELFLKIINMSISASWLILVVLIIRLVLRKAPKWVNVLLWGIVAVRIICPFSIESMLSLIPSSETIPMNIEMDTKPAIDSGINAVDNVINSIISASFTPRPEASANPLQIWIYIASAIWLVGMVLMLLYATITYLHLLHKVETAVIYKDNIYQSENVSTPFVLGIIRPKIYLSFKTDGKNLEHVVAHEKAHIRRKDHLWKPLGFLLLTIHWFNPLMWLAYVLLCRDIELACDEKVIKELGNEQRADYTQALVACSVNRRMIAACPLAFGEVGVKERVKSVMNYKKPAFWIIVLSVVVCAVVAVCFLTNPRRDSYSIRIVVPAGSQEAFVYSEEEISPLGNYIVVTTGDGLGDTEVSLKTVQVKKENAYDEPAYLTPGMSVKLEAEKGGWFKIGVNMQNNTDEDIVVYVDVKKVEVRISDEKAPKKIMFNAEILEVSDGYFLVVPVEGSPELNSSNQIVVHRKNMDSTIEPQVGDIVEITYNGEILETYPAQLREVFSIRVIERLGDNATDNAADNITEDITDNTTDNISDNTTGDMTLQAYTNLLSGDRSLLNSAHAEQWYIPDFQNSGGILEYEYTYMDLNGDGMVELLVQMVNEPTGYNGVFHYEDGQLFCWNSDAMEMSCRDYPLNDGTMVRQYDMNSNRTYTIFHYLSNGEKEDILRLIERNELMDSDSTEPFPYYEVGGNEVDKEVFEEQLNELITNKILERSAWVKN